MTRRPAAPPGGSSKSRPTSARTIRPVTPHPAPRVATSHSTALPGVAYVYLNYGIHYLTNVVTEREGFPAAVLLRALAPLEGVELMRRRRARSNGRSADALALSELCRGPGNLSKALGITLRDNRRDMISSRLTIEDWGLKADAADLESADRHSGRRREAMALL